METRIGLAFAVWMAFVASGLYFVASRNVERKLRWWRPYNVVGAVLFLAVMFAWGFPIVMIGVAGVFVAFTTSLNLRRPPPFCTNCGASVWPTGLFSRPTFCARCGARLSDQAATRQVQSSTGRSNER